jgi:N-methylhydantoinase B
MNAGELDVAFGILHGIAEEMGAALIRSALSPNIKERRDCSTALFDADGRLTIQAEHMPVHLGAMPASVAAVRRREPAAGEIWCLNDPFTGGSHLPDITLVSPIVVDGERMGYAASRAHHADVGGMVPASMPAESTEIYQEGLIIPPSVIADRDGVNAALVELIALNSRAYDERIGDLEAQMAVHRLAERRVAEVCGRRSRTWYHQAGRELFDYSERRARAAIHDMPDGTYSAEETVETAEADLTIAATVSIRGDSVEIDFEGTSAQFHGNLNCPIAVTEAACYFVIQVVADPDLPAAGGAHAPVTVRAPKGSLVNAERPAAVAAGNVETSSRIVDCLLLALGEAVEAPAQGQGTMNNVTLGNSRFTYYETTGGGQGACASADGPSGVHVAMSNTLNTPIEALELAYPLRVEEYRLRDGTGGRGAHRGGDGVTRSLRALEACELSILADRRRHQPKGARGGEPGARGRNCVNGLELPPKVRRRLQPGDVVSIDTPGGGGYGTSTEAASQETR